MTEAVHEAVDRAVVGAGMPEHVATTLLGVEARTLHRLLGYRDGIRFRHDAADPLPHDLVVVDETSMVDLPMMGKLLDALRPTAQLVLVGDPFQLASVEAGAVLSDIVGPVARRPDATAWSAHRLDRRAPTHPPLRRRLLHRRAGRRGPRR